MSKQSPSIIRVSEEVRDTLASGGAVVALESTIFSNLGLPSPANAQALAREARARLGRQADILQAYLDAITPRLQG